MQSKPLRVLALLATALVIVSGIYKFFDRPTGQPGAKRPTGVVSQGKKKPAQAHLPCTIRHAAFGGTQASVLRFAQGRFSHYVVMDHPFGNPLVPFYQRDWIESNFGEAQPDVLGVFATIDEAIARAATLCRRN